MAKRLLDLVGAVASDGPLPDRLSALCAELCDLLGCDRSSVFLSDGRHFLPVANAGNPPAMEARFAESRFRLDDPLFSECVRTGLPVHVADAVADPRISERVVSVAGVRSIIVAPVLAPDRVGVITAEFNETAARFGAFAKETVLGIARLAAVAVELVDVSERDAGQSAILRWQSEHDSLTGLPNRRLLRAELDHLCSEGRSELVAVLLADLDRFKVINDGLGHEVGDAVLVEVAHRLTAPSLPGVVVGRLGGDEFVLVGLVADEAAALEMAAEVESRLEPPVSLDGQRQLRVSASVGVAVASAEVAEPSALLRDADAAMYVAKKQSRTRSAVASVDHRTVLLNRLEVESELPQALAAGEIVPWFQPIVELSSGAVVGVESLARWEHPTRGVLEPGEFLPSLFEIRMGSELTRSMVRQSLEALSAAGTSDGVDLFVNIAADELRDSTIDLTNRIEREVGDARHLVLEITEDTAITVAGLGASLDDLAGHGIGLAIDDFGTGYSSFSVLRDLPVDIVKIDASLLRGERDQAEEILRAISSLCRALGRRVLAEGVETERDLDLVTEVGIDLAQGYFLGRPAPPLAALRTAGVSGPQT